VPKRVAVFNFFVFFNVIAFLYWVDVVSPKNNVRSEEHRIVAPGLAEFKRPEQRLLDSEVTTHKYDNF
jgi:hypothetical protein